jgi:hypothetical protein
MMHMKRAFMTGADICLVVTGKHNGPDGRSSFPGRGTSNFLKTKPVSYVDTGGVLSNNIEV